MDDRIPPHSIEAEEAVLSSILVEPEAITKVSGWLKPEDFKSGKNRQAYAACLALASRGEVIDQLTLIQELRARGEDVGGHAYMAHIISILPTSVHLEYYANIVHRLAVLRKLIDAGDRIAAVAYAQDGTLPEITMEVQSILDQACGISPSSKDLVWMDQAVSEAWDDIEGWIGAGHDRLRGVSSPFPKLNRVIDGLERGKLYLVAARPGMGKTAWLLEVAKYVARSRPIIMFSLEQPRRALIDRLALSEMGLDRYAVRAKGISQESIDKLIATYGDLSDMRFGIYDKPAVKVAEAQSIVSSLQTKHDIALVVFDYLDIAGDKGEGEQRVSAIGQGLKDMARACDVPVLAAGQLNRQVEMRPDKRPHLSDLRMSGMLEAVSDVVMFLYRPQYYIDRNIPVTDTLPIPDKILYLTVAKNKDGPVREIDLWYDPSTGRMREMTKEG